MALPDHVPVVERLGPHGVRPEPAEDRLHVGGGACADISGPGEGPSAGPSAFPRGPHPGHEIAEEGEVLEPGEAEEAVADHPGVPQDDDGPAADPRAKPVDHALVREEWLESGGQRPENAPALAVPDGPAVRLRRLDDVGARHVVRVPADPEAVEEQRDALQVEVLLPEVRARQERVHEQQHAAAAANEPLQRVHGLRCPPVWRGAWVGRVVRVRADEDVHVRERSVRVRLAERPQLVAVRREGRGEVGQPIRVGEVVGRVPAGVEREGARDEAADRRGGRRVVEGVQRDPGHVGSHLVALTSRPRDEPPGRRAGPGDCRSQG